MRCQVRILKYIQLKTSSLSPGSSLRLPEPERGSVRVGPALLRPGWVIGPPRGREGLSGQGFGAQCLVHSLWQFSEAVSTLRFEIKSQAFFAETLRIDSVCPPGPRTLTLPDPSGCVLPLALPLPEPNPTPSGPLALTCYPLTCCSRWLGHCLHPQPARMLLIFWVRQPIPS